MIRWAINLSTLLLEVPFLDRFQAAADLGFAAVEFWWPGDVDLDAVLKAKEAAGVAVALFNADGGSAAAGERGYLGNPAKSAYLRAHFAEALAFAGALKCSLIHVLGGNRLDSLTRAEQLEEAVTVQRELCAMAAPQGVIVTLEPLNRRDIPRFLFPTSEQALEQLAKVSSPNLKLQYDVYHMQRAEGSIVETIRAQINQIVHIQFADVPGRAQPGTGELNFPFILREVQRTGYSGYFGLEYFVQTGSTTEASLSWLPKQHRISYDALTMDALAL